MADETSFTPKPSTVPDAQHRPIIHTYGDDMAHAMDATDAKVVAELLETAREREAMVIDARHRKNERAWYSAGAIILLILAIGAGAYGVYHYQHLTVPAAPTYSVGVFPSINPISTTEIAVRDMAATLETLDTLSLNKPTLVPLVDASGNALTNDEVFAYIGAKVSEPFATAVDVVRFGIMDNGTKVTAFLIFSVGDPELATKEFLIAEPTLLQLFSGALGINPADTQAEVGKNFVSEYRYNLPLRTLSATDIETDTRRLLLYYGYATDHTIVLATDPSVLKAVYDSIINQH